MTKTISAVYNVTTKEWTVRDNGQVVAQGQGLRGWSYQLIDLKQNATKPVRVRTTHQGAERLPFLLARRSWEKRRAFWIRATQGENFFKKSEKSG